jgi:dTMP kinase
VKEKNFPGTFIVIEGADGAGTTTQSERLAEKIGAELTFEPTDKKIGRKVDEMISGDNHSPETTALGFAADRMVHLEERVIPWLEQGKTVVSDRYAHSSLAYQPVMGAEREWVETLNRDILKPDLTVILDISAEVGMSRVEDRGRDGNVFEQMDFQQKVVRKYREMEERENTVLVDASKGKDEVFRQVKTAVEEKLDF